MQNAIGHTISDTSRKRPRSEDSSPATKKLLRAHEILWYDDGNVIIIAGSVTYRVHKGVLSKSSTVLRALVATAEIVAGENSARVLLDDDPVSVEHLLYSLYNAKCTEAKQVSLLFVSAWLRLGTKYEISHLRDEAIRRLKICYPNTLSAFDEVAEGSDCQPIESLPENCCEDLLVAFLALSYDLPSVIPSALYWHTVRWQPKTPLPEIQATIQEYGHGINCDELSVLQKCFVGAHELTDFCITERFSFLNGPVSADCVSQKECKSAAKRMLAYAQQKAFYFFCALDVLHDFFKRYEADACDACNSFFKAQHQASRMKIWARLPGCFDVQLTDKEWPVEVTDNNL